MIQLECSNCNAQLAIDDAFAGGVCRCQHCGTIQTVPKAGLENNADSPKALFKRKARIESALNPYNDGLDRAADEMDSSGALSASALANVPNRRFSSPLGDDTGNSSHNGTPARRSVSQSATAAAVRPAYVPKPSASSKVSETSAPSKTADRSKMVKLIAAGAALALLGAIATYAFTGNADESPSNDENVTTLSVGETAPKAERVTKAEPVIVVEVEPVTEIDATNKTEPATDPEPEVIRIPPRKIGSRQ